MNLFNSMVILLIAVTESTATFLSERFGALADSDAGEGAVSAAIAVLIFAFLGVILWVAFKATMGTATNAVNAQVAKLGQ